MKNDQMKDKKVQTKKVAITLAVNKKQMQAAAY